MKQEPSALTISVQHRLDFAALPNGAQEAAKKLMRDGMAIFRRLVDFSGGDRVLAVHCLGSPR